MPRFAPDERQAEALRDLAEVAARISTAEADRLQMIKNAYELGVPIEWIAREVHLMKKTVYRRLGFKMP